MMDPTDWCYPSGVTAVLETFLLTPRAVAELADADELLSRARRSPVYAGVHVPEGADPMQIAAALESALVAYIRPFAQDCPERQIADVFLTEYALRDVSNRLKSQYCAAERHPVELSSLSEEELDAFIAAEPLLSEITDTLAEASHGGPGPIAASTVDLMIDGAFIAMLPQLAEPLGSELVDRWAEARQRATATEAALRARIAGIEDSDVGEHLLGRLPPQTAAAVLAEAEAFDSSGGPGSLQALAARHDAELGRILEPARYVAFGPERVFGYLWRLSGENRNLRAALGGFAGQIEPELVAQSMRGTDG